MSDAAQIVVLATLDTKESEAAYVADLLRRSGHRPCLMDTGFSQPPASRPDVDREQVARAADVDPASVRLLPREEAIRRMGEGAGALLARGAAEGRYTGVIALGGNQGTAIAGIAFRRLPFGLPKVAVSTVASGDLRPYFGHKDVAVFFSVADILGGPNLISRPVLEAATAAIAGMVVAARGSVRGSQRAIAVTAFGNTHGAVTAVHALLRERGREVVAFHASGAGGSAMEELIETGLFEGVLDLTTHELAAEICSQDVYAPTRPGRLTAAARRGLPQVVAPGGLDYFCFGAADTIPEAYRGRATHRHNPYNSNVRTTAAESAQLGELMAARLNSAPPGTAAFLYPQRGWSEIGSPGGPLHDPAANRAFLDSLRAALSPSVELQVLDLAINDRGFAERAVEVLERLAA
ncbi:MAG TPA: Tm-1-like ATP-binding domain-containing protein [Myxococcales bacterium]|nr:Tm-1-like ATP-binding domain-containing protein [Myxococcales bacterium]